MMVKIAMMTAIANKVPKTEMRTIVVMRSVSFTLSVSNCASFTPTILNLTVWPIDKSSDEEVRNCKEEASWKLDIPRLSMYSTF